MKKQKQLEDLVSETSKLQMENNQLKQNIDVSYQRYVEIESANNVLRAQASELTDRLRSLNSVLQLIEEVNGFTLDIPEIPDSFLEPWQIPCPVQPVMASAEMFEY